VAAVGDGRAFERGRDMAAWLGLVPQQRTTGGKPRLLGISKRGNRYLRKNLIHGARAVLPHLAQRDTPLGRKRRNRSRMANRIPSAPALRSTGSKPPTSPNTSARVNGG
jgi:transposase